MKLCFKCNVHKPVEEFYRHPRMADGRLGKCKTCTKADVSANYAKRRAEYSAYDKARLADPARRAWKIEAERRYRLRNPVKAKARTALRHAVRDGRVKKLPCVVCGDPKSQAHHHDYTRPLDVTWMCFKCHREIGHGQVVTCPF